MYLTSVNYVSVHGGRPLRVLVTDASSLSARQAITALGEGGAHVEAVDPSGIALARFSRHLRRLHRVPPFGSDPFAWLDATLQVLERGGHDLLFPTHEQTAVLAHAATRVRATGAALAVPRFAALARLQDKHAASETLQAAGLRQPRTRLAGTPDAVRAAQPPVYLKSRVGTASAGVFLARDRAALTAATDRLSGLGAFDHGGVLIQQPLEGRVAMIQSVFHSGALVGHHVAVRLREGADGSSSHKVSAHVPGVAADLSRLGAALGWHGALSLDAILTPAGPSYIDVNPRLVEPGNAQLAGTDLVGMLVAIALGRPLAPATAGREGVRTHQLLAAMLGAAQRGRGRRGVLGEAVRAALASGSYADSSEELLPLRRDPAAGVPLAAVAAALIARPAAHRAFARGAVGNYALTPAAWRQIVDAHHAAAPAA